MEPTDSQLVIDCLNLEEGAFETIVNRYAKPIYNFIFRLCGARNESDDLTQEVFLKVWKNLKHFDTEKNFKTWIYSIARNTAIDWMRKRKIYAFSQLNSPDKEEDFGETLPDVLPLPDEIFEGKELASKLEDALLKISPTYKTIVLLHIRESLTFEEIAEVVEKPMNTVKSQYRRALIELRKHISKT